MLTTRNIAAWMQFRSHLARLFWPACRMSCRRALLALALTFVLAGGIMPRPASAQVVYTQYFSLGCEFWGEANVTYGQSLTRGATYRTNSCADYATAGYDYYYAGQWYGTYYNWCYTSWQNACVKENYLGATQVYTYHQIYTQGYWRQWEYGYASG